MKKHAYLIIAHNNWKILERLLILLEPVGGINLVHT